MPNYRRIPAQSIIENLVCSIGCVLVVATVARAPEDPRSTLLIGSVAALLPVPTAFSAPVPSGRGSRLRERPGELLVSSQAVGAAGCGFILWTTGIKSPRHGSTYTVKKD